MLSYASSILLQGVSEVETKGIEIIPFMNARQKAATADAKISRAISWVIFARFVGDVEPEASMIASCSPHRADDLFSAKAEQCSLLNPVSR
jgi:hypothetical protein